ncbi:hypothetical protein ACFQL4_01660 [Halosimplex aquaticum]
MRNDDDAAHEVTVEFDRGRSYPVRNWTRSVESGATASIDGVLHSSDWPYGFFLHVFVDGDHVNTTSHRLDGDVTLVVGESGDVTANATEVLTDERPKRRYGTESGRSTAADEPTGTTAPGDPGAAPSRLRSPE